MLGLLGAVFGENQARRDREAASAAMQEALRMIQGVEVPDPAKMKIILEELQSAGDLTPELEMALTQKSSEMEGVQADPRLKAAEMGALERMKGIAKGGFSIEDRAAMQESQNAVAQAARGREEAILQNMQARGQGGSGNELAARMIASQGATQQASQNAMNIAAEANKRALQAIGSQGDMASRMGSTDFAQKSARAQAADEIARFNTTNRQNVMSRNNQTVNAARSRNLENKQGLMNQNTGLRNQQETHNKGLVQQDFNNRLSKGQAAANALTGQAAFHSATADKTAQKWAQVGQGLDQTGMSVATMAMASDKNLKKDMHEGDQEIRNLLDRLTPKSYSYKDEKHGRGRQVGVLAQDLEQSDMGKSMVEDTPEGKMVDVKKAASASLAAVADLHKRLKRLEGVE